MPERKKADGTARAPLERARAKAREVRQDLNVAGGELELSRTILERKLAPEQKAGDVGKALAQSDSAKRKVVRAEDELHHVEELLHEEEARRERLERELARRKTGS